MTATAPPRPRMHPRIGRRRAEVTRARGRRRLRAVVVATVVVGLAVGVLVVLHSPLFSARHVTVVGATHTGRAAVVRAAGLRGEPPLVDVAPPAAAARVEALPWVDTARVSRLWPDRVVVVVTERVPLVTVSAHGASFLVDASGRVLARASGPSALPVLASPSRTGRPGSFLAASARPGLLVAEASRRLLAGRVQGVRVAANGDVTLDLGKGVGATLGGAGSVDAKLAALASVLAAAPPTGPETIDVSVPGEPTVAPGASAAA